MPKRSLYARPLRAFTTAGAAACLLAASPACAHAQERAPCAECIVLTASPGQSLLAGETLNGLEILVHATGAAEAIQAALRGITDRDGRPGLWIRGLAQPAVEPAILSLATRVVVDASGEPVASDQLAFRLKTHFTELRSAGSGLLLGIHARPDVLRDLLQRDLGAYIDFVVPAAAADPPFPAHEARGALSIQDASRGEDASGPRWIVPLPSDVLAAQRLLSDLAQATPFLPRGLISGGMVDVGCGQRSVPTFLNPETLDTVAVVSNCPVSQVSIGAGMPEAVRLLLSTGDLVVKVPAPEGRYAQGVEVVGARTLSVREIIARHQAAAARQRRHVRQLISTGRMTLIFEAPGFPAPVTITTDPIIFTDGQLVEIEQRDIRVNGVAFRGNRVPRLPLLEPERVVSLPLAISLTDVYRYSLEGLEPVAGVNCYVVSFEPIDRRRSLYAGRAWIAADDFGMVKVSAVQTALRGPIVSSEQIDEFRRESPSVWVLARSTVHQIYEGAGHRTPIQRVLAIERQEINPPAFAARRQSAYGSSSVMLRDTAEGFRYLRREEGSGGDGRPPDVVLEKAAERVRTVALGAIVDPNIDRPLPFAGISYVDFNLFNTGTQLNGFFGGTFGQIAVAVPSLGGTRWQAAARAFGIASSYNDRAFVEGREVHRANISQRPAYVSGWLLRPLGARLTARAGYEFDYTAYDRVDSTSASFVVPADQAAHAIRVGLEGQWSGWSASAWWLGARRAGWRRWGEDRPDGEDYRPGHRDYQRFGSTLTRSFVASAHLVGRVEAALMAGRDLDRFSRYSFGSFDNRLRGYPSALIRYDRGGVVRGALAWAAGRYLRIDGFLDSAYVRDPGFGSRFRNYTGVGAAVEVPAPFGTLAAVEWGYGFRGIDREGRRGTQVVRISGYKMF